jgi:hypothetical protein
MALASWHGPPGCITKRQRRGTRYGHAEGIIHQHKKSEKFKNQFVLSETNWESGGVIQAVEHLPSKHKAPSSNPIPPKKERN